MHTGDACMHVVIFTIRVHSHAHVCVCVPDRRYCIVLALLRLVVAQQKLCLYAHWTTGGSACSMCARSYVTSQ